MRKGLLCLAMCSTLAFAQDEEAAFDIRQLPPGADVTLPHPATTVVPMDTLHRIIPTDYNQVLKLTSTGGNCAVKVLFYDRASPDVKTRTLKTGETMIYRFQKLSSILVNSRSQGNCQKVARLVLESNRPMGVGL